MSEQNAVSINPFTGEQFSSYPFIYEDAIADEMKKIPLAKQWGSESTPEERSKVLLEMARILRNMASEISSMITREMGKPISQSLAEVEKSACLCEWYAEKGPIFLSPQNVPVDKGTAKINFEPIGAVLAVMPWNFPIWQIMRGAVAAIMTGNPYVLKPAPNVIGCANLISEAWKTAGLPEGCFLVINTTPEGVSYLIKDRMIALVAVTGSVRAGQAIAAQAGKELKRCLPELGGSDPFIVLEGADVDEAVKAAVIGRYQNTGQVCLAAKRIIVEKSILTEFTAKFLEATKALRIGNPFDAQTDIGPMARYDLREELHRQVMMSAKEGAEIILGGEKIEGKGNFYAPTILTNVTSEMTAFKEELFGPVAVIITAENERHAIELANDSEFGLSATVWSGKEDAEVRYTSKLECGSVFINGYSASDQRLPVGGIKKSGYGRELSYFGLHEFCNIKTSWVDRR